MRIILEKLNNIIENLDNLKEIRELLENLNRRSISWEIYDFEAQATQNEGFYNKENIYDRDKFQYALELMIAEHDANVGISWNIIDIYLNKYCKYE
jgi:hypothetical protein